MPCWPSIRQPPWRLPSGCSEPPRPKSFAPAPPPTRARTRSSWAWFSAGVPGPRGTWQSGRG
eukprot:11185012-Lingulodinium_polyedra.AAC.1